MATAQETTPAALPPQGTLSIADTASHLAAHSGHEAVDEEAVAHLEREAGYSREGAVDFLERQMDLLVLAAELADDLPAYVGGMYFDHDNGGVLTVRVTDHGRERVRRFVEARVQAEDFEIADWVAIIKGRASLAGIEQARAALVGDLADDPGEDSCSSQFSCQPPLRGGIRMNKCTTGFMAENAAGAYYTITAGHCLSGNYYHDVPRVIGSKTCAEWHTSLGCKVGGAPASGVYTESGSNGTNVDARIDAARVYVSDLSYWGPRGRNVYLYSNVNYLAIPRKWWSPCALPANTFMHRAGGESGTTTGFVHLACRTWTSTSNVYYENKLIATYNRKSGDSGSPALTRYQQTVGGTTIPAATAIAIHKGPLTISGTEYSVASHIRYVETRLGVHLRDAVRVP